MCRIMTTHHYSFSTTSPLFDDALNAIISYNSLMAASELLDEVKKYESPADILSKSFWITYKAEMSDFWHLNASVRDSFDVGALLTEYNTCCVTFAGQEPRNTYPVTIPRTLASLLGTDIIRKAV